MDEQTTKRALSEGEQGAEIAEATGTSGDPMLKRLVDLAHLGWTTRLTLLSNGEFVTGALISPAQFRAALADSIRSRNATNVGLAGLDELVAQIIEAEEPPVPDPNSILEPRFVHLADVRVVGRDAVVAPFMRLRLPAVSGFWVATGDEKRER